MIVVMRAGAPTADADRVMALIRERGGRVSVFHGEERLVITSIGTDGDEALLESVERLPGVDRVTPLKGGYRLASREFRPADTVVDVGGVPVGGGSFAVIAGPCIVENRSRLLAGTRAAAAAGASILRGDAFRHPASPYATQGLGAEGLALLIEARGTAGRPIATEVSESTQVPVVSYIADLLEVGSANMLNVPLLRALGSAGRPVLLKRALLSTVDEWLTAAEHILHAGNPNVILCERGIRTFEADRPSTLDLSSIPVLKRLTHLPVVVDPSHGTGHAFMVRSMALAAAAVGADGLVIEVHVPEDEAAGPQSLPAPEFAELMTALEAVLGATGRTVAQPRGLAAPEAAR